MDESKTKRVKYIYLDVVGFTYNRTVEAQIQIVSALNRIVRETITKSFPQLDVVYIPIGDGICISLLDSKVYDDYITIAEAIIRTVDVVHNPMVTKTRQFQVRIGINENVDNIITDINGNQNVCGSGVNDAQRIMSFADSNQVLVGRTVADSLMPREKYAKAFRRYAATTKHNANIEIYQYIGGKLRVLNREPPSAFAPPPKQMLTEYAAYYIATILQNRSFIETKIEQASWAKWALALHMAYLAEDSLGHSKESKLIPYDNRIPDTPNNTLEEQFQLFANLPWNICFDLYDAKITSQLSHSYSDCFEEGSRGIFITASEKGKQRLENEYPHICKQFNPQ